MYAVIFLISLWLITTFVNAQQYKDKDGNIVPTNPCKNDSFLYSGSQIYRCNDGQIMLQGCKVDNGIVHKETVKIQNNIVTVYCGQRFGFKPSDTIHVQVTDGTELTCRQATPGAYTATKKASPTKISDCSLGQTKVISNRYLLECFQEFAGFLSYKLAACFLTSSENGTIKIPASKTFDEFSDKDKKFGFRYSCYQQFNNFYLEPIGCFFNGTFIQVGHIFENGSIKLLCMRDGSQKLRLRPIYKIGEEQLCTETKFYNQGLFKFECVPGLPPKPIGCVQSYTFKRPMEVLKHIPEFSPSPFFSYMLYCLHIPDFIPGVKRSNSLTIIKSTCMDDIFEGVRRQLYEGGRRVYADGSSIECRRHPDHGLLRVYVAGKPKFANCKAGEKEFKNFVQFECKGSRMTATACVPFNNESVIVQIGKTYDTNKYQYKCEQQGKDVVYRVIACFDGDKKIMKSGEKRQIKNSTFECLNMFHNDLILIKINGTQCEHPTNSGNYIRPYDFIKISKNIPKLIFKVVFQCVAEGSKGYRLKEIGCEVDGKKYTINEYINHGQDVYQCARPYAEDIILNLISANQLNCPFADKEYKNGEEFATPDEMTFYQCRNGQIFKTGCYLCETFFPVNQHFYCNNAPYFCPEEGEGHVVLPLRGCYLKNGTLIKIGQTFKENNITYACEYTHQDLIYEAVIVPIGCIYQGVNIPINRYIQHKNKHIVCEMNVASFKVSAYPATKTQEACIKKTATYNCGNNGNENHEGGLFVPGDGEYGLDYFEAIPQSVEYYFPFEHNRNNSENGLTSAFLFSNGGDNETQPEPCTDLLPAPICQQLYPFCLPLTTSKEAASSEASNNNASKSVNAKTTQTSTKKITILPQQQQIVNKLPTVSEKRSLLEMIENPNKASCEHLQKQCQLNSTFCELFVPKCTSKLDNGICKAPSQCTQTKNIYKAVFGELVSQLCPITCKVEECSNNQQLPSKLDLDDFPSSKLVTCLTAKN